MLTFSIDGFDLSPFVQVGHEEGLDPANSEFSEPQFSGSAALREGQGWVSDAVSNRHVVVPLFLKAADVDHLHQLIRDIEALLIPGAQVEFTMDGAGGRNFFDLERGRLNARFEYWIARASRLRTTIELWTRPYSNTGTHRTIASLPAGAATDLIATRSVVHFPATGILGDVDALANLEVRVGSAVASSGRVVAYGVHPHPSFNPLHTPSDGLLTPQANSTVIGASGTIASKYYAIPVSPTTASGVALTDYLTPPDAHIGRHRVIGIARSGLEGPILIKAIDRFGAPLGPGAAATQTDQGKWQLVDLGEVQVTGRASGMEPVPTQTVSLIAAGLGAEVIASPALHVAGLVYLPLDGAPGLMRTRGVFGALGLYADGFNRLAGGQFLQNLPNADPGPGVWSQGYGALGGILTMQAGFDPVKGASAGGLNVALTTFQALSFTPAVVPGTGFYKLLNGYRAYDDISAQIDVTLRGLPISATVASGAIVNLSPKAQDTGFPAISVQLNVGPSPPALSIIAASNNLTGQLLASAALSASVASAIHGRKTHTIWIDSIGQNVAAYIATGPKPATPVVQANSGLAAAFAGNPALYMQTVATNSATAGIFVDNLLAYSVGSPAQDANPRRWFRFDSHPQARAVQANASIFEWDRTAEHRGDPPRLPAVGSESATGPARVVVLSGDVENFVGNDLVDVRLDVLERFSYAR